MENEQKRKYWFFGSKLNTVLLVVLIVLMVFAIKEMRKNADFYKQNLGLKDTYQIPVGDTAYEKDNSSQSNNNTITLDPSDSYTKQYKTIFSEALKKPADFNGHYVVASYGCGSGCMAFGVVDKNTGKAYQGPTDDYGGGYQISSNFEATRYSLGSNLFKVVGYSAIQTYKFDGTQFVLVQ